MRILNSKKLHMMMVFAFTIVFTLFSGQPYAASLADLANPAIEPNEIVDGNVRFFDWRIISNTGNPVSDPTLIDVTPLGDPNEPNQPGFLFDAKGTMDRQGSNNGFRLDIRYKVGLVSTADPWLGFNRRIIELLDWMIDPPAWPDIDPWIAAYRAQVFVQSSSGSPLSAFAMVGEITDRSQYAHYLNVIEETVFSPPLRETGDITEVISGQPQDQSSISLKLFTVRVGLVPLMECPADFCEDQINTLCTEGGAGGFEVNFVEFVPAAPSNSGAGTYTYEICSPPEGVCASPNTCSDGTCTNIGGVCASDADCTVRAGESCSDNSFCQKQGSNLDPNAFCTRDCAVDDFKDLSHFDVAFPGIVAGSCVELDATCVSGQCSNDNTISCSVDDDCRTQITFTQTGSTGGDGVILTCQGQTQDNECGFLSPHYVAKCNVVTDSTLDPGECAQMELTIAGETNGIGEGAVVVASKAGANCSQECISGPSCEPCDGASGDGEECLTRTRGFWGTHPHLIQSDDLRSLDLLPITVCGVDQTTTDADVCGTSEALCTNAKDRNSNSTSLTLVAQLTAAKLNLAATAAVSEGTCSDWTFDDEAQTGELFEGQGIGAIIATCEADYCGARKQDISNSGCIEALDAFNNSEDNGFDQTPYPFNRPGPALIDECLEARGNRTSNYNCGQP